MHYRWVLCAVLLLTGLLVWAGCGDVPAARPEAPAGAVGAPGVQERSVRHAEGFRLTEHEGYTRLRTMAAGDTTTYLLVPRGQAPPPGVQADYVVETPVRSVVALSSAHVAMLHRVGQEARVVGVDRLGHVNTASVRRRIEQGQVAEVGTDEALNVEQILLLEPDLVTSYVSGGVHVGGLGQLRAAGVPVLLVQHFDEASPLGRAEWVKALAAFFEAGDAAEAAFAEVEAAYEGLAARARAAAQRPTLFAGMPFRGTWFVPGGDSHRARLFADAGGAYRWADNPSRQSVPLAFEAVYARAAETAYWIGAPSYERLGDLVASEPRLAAFRAVREGRVYADDARLTPEGGNDLWETGAVRPDLVLADLVHILHPELLPDHELFFYRCIAPCAGSGVRAGD